MKNLQDNDVLTVGVFSTELKTSLDVVVAKMMAGFSALDSKIDTVDKVLGEKIDRAALDSEHRDRALSAQIQHLAFTKADWNDIV